MKYFNYKFLTFILALAVAIPPAWADETLTVCDQGTTNSYTLPLYGQGYYDQTNQMIYPASMLEDMVGKSITGLTFYHSKALTTGGAINVALGNTTQATYSSATAITGLTTVASNKAYTAGDSEIVIEFDEAFLYTGDNLVIQISVATKGSYASSSFVGVSQSSNTSYYAYSWSSGGSLSGYVQQFLPKATFTYEGELQPYAAKVSPASIDFGKTVPNMTLTQNVTVKNTGANAITPTLSGLTAPFSTTYTSASLASGETATIPIVFNPTTTGEFTATLQVGFTDGNIATVEIPLSGMSANETTVGNGGTTDACLPVYGNWFDADTQTNQMLYSASMLTELAGKKITSMTFYAPNGIKFYRNNNTATVTFKLANMDANTSGFDNTPYHKDADFTTVNEYTMPSQSEANAITEWRIEFDEPFPYNGGDLLLEVNTVKGSYGNTYFSGDEQNTNQSYYSYNSNAYNSTFLPKVTFEFVDDNIPATPTVAIAPEALTINDAAAGTFTVTGTNVDGSINASLASNTDWYMTPEQLANTGGDLSVSYTGRALSANNTINVTAASDNTVSAQATVNYVADLYIVTDNGQTGNWDFNNGTQMTNNDGTYTVTFTANADNTFILFARKLGDGVNWNTRYVFGPDSNGDWLLNGDSGEGTIDLNDDDPIKLPNAGTYNITINSDGTFTITKVLEQVATPTFSPAEGTFTEAQTVTISCATDGATISYSTDGGTTWTVGNSLTVSETTTVMAKATKDGMTDSETATATYTIKTNPSGQEQSITIGDESTTSGYLPVYGAWYDAYQQNQMIYSAAALGFEEGTVITSLTFYPSSGLNFSGGKVTLSLGTTTGTWAQGAYNPEPMNVNVTQVAEVVPEANSSLTEWTFTFDTPFEYTGGNLFVQIDTETGNDATTNFYGTTQDTNVGYYAYGYASPSPRGLLTFLPKATFTYIGGDAPEQVATPTFTPAAGTYASAQSVTIACATDGATIYYTTDGTEPSATNGTVYSDAIAVSETTTIKAIAIKSGMTNSAVAEAEYIINIPVDYAVTVSPDGGTLNFGTVDHENNATATRTITVTNTGLNPVTPTLSALSAPFSTDYTATALQPGESVTITITFTPTEEASYNGTATLSFGNGIDDRTFTITGKGGKYNENDHSAIYDKEYTWIDDNGDTHTSNLLDIATDPNQIIAMLRKVYMDKDIPGIKVRGYEDPVANEATPSYNRDNGVYPPVAYPAVGTIVQGENNELVYSDAYGWNIPTSMPLGNITGSTYQYKYFDPTEYEPNEDGLTLILVEIKDGVNDVQGSSSYYGVTSGTLKDKVEHTFKSARILTSYKKSAIGTDKEGTLFKIDADKLNRYFILGKGKPRLADHSNNDGDWECYYPSLRWKKSYNPFASNSSTNFTDNSLIGNGVMAPFLHMFEEFSPNLGTSSTDAQTDQYQKLVNMQTFNVYHDCLSVAFIGGHHEFNMYGLESESEDCQDVRDMMFFVPKYRMKYWYNSSGQTDRRDWGTRFYNYHPDYLPKMGLYVIRQNEITGEQKNDNAYELHLSWESNLLDFLPGDEGQYFLYRVITDANGNKTYQPVVQVDENGDTVLVNGEPVIVTLDPNQTTYTDYVAMQGTGQIVTYVVQGQDNTQFLTLQMSNEESYIIPGTDPNELMSLDVRATHYSRFDPQSEKNFYSNTLKLKNNVGTSVTADMLTTGAQFVFNRMYTDAQSVAHTDVVATATVTSNNGSHVILSIAMQNQRELSEYPYGYRANKGETTFNITNGVVDFSDFTIYDNFGVSVEGNQHPAMYKYKVLFGEKHSNEIGVMVHKTGMEMIAHDQETVGADVLHNEEILNRAFNIDVKYSSKTEILRYDAYRWRNDEEVTETRKIIESGNSDGTEEEDVAPNGIAGNQATFYTIAMNNDYTGRVDVSQTVATAKAKFEDNIATQTWGAYVLAPVVETFTGRDDYNTYGGPLQGTATSSMQITVKDSREMSEYNWTDSTTHNVYCYYTIPLDIVDMKVPDGYNVYKLRAWRKVNTTLLQEQLDARQYRLGVNGDYLFDEVTYPNYDKNANYEIGSPVVEEYQTTTTPTETGYELKATFGAQKLSDGNEAGTITELPMVFVVRAYYTKESNLAQPNGKRAPRRIDGANADGKYYIMEQTIPFTLVKDDQLITSVHGVYADKQVKDVIYYNMMGQSSTMPFSGVNVKVTRYADGSFSTIKVHK